MAFEDSSEFSLAGVPSALFSVDRVEPVKLAAARRWARLCRSDDSGDSKPSATAF
jgi:hypothetical protein